MASDQIRREDLIKEIKSHNLQELSRNLSAIELSSISVKRIQKKENLGFTEYKIEMVNGGDFIVQDLVDVRYDFEKDNLRRIDPEETISCERLWKLCFV